MKLFINTIVPCRSQSYYDILLDLEKVKKFKKPCFFMRLKKKVRSKLNPYSNYRLKNKISKCEIYFLKKINNILKNKYVSKYIY